MRADRMTLPLYAAAAADTPSFLRRGRRQILLLLLAALYGVAMAYLPPQLVVLPMIPIIVLLLLILWMLPDRATFPEHSLEQSFSWFVALYYLWPSYIAIALPGLPWFSAGRIALLVLMVIALYSLATSSVFRRQMFVTAQTSKTVWTLFLVQLGAQVVPLLLSSTPFAVLTHFANNQMYWTALFFIGCFLFVTPGRATRFAALFVGLAIFLSVFGVLEHYQERLIWAGHIPSFLKVDNDRLLDIVMSGQARDFFGGYRVHSTFTVSLLFAEFLSLALPFLLHWMVTGQSRWLRFGMMLGWVPIALCILYTDSRLGKIGFIVAHVGYALIWGLRRRRRNPGFLSTAVVAGFPVAAALGLTLMFASHRVHVAIMGSEGYTASNDARYEQVAMGIPKILANPLGYGAGSAGYILGYTSPGGQLTIDSQYLKTTLEFGVIGALAIYAMFLWAAWLGLRLYFRANEREIELAGPAGLMLLSYVVIKGVLAEDYNYTLAYLGVAMVLALLARFAVAPTTVPQSAAVPSVVGRRLSDARPG